MRPFIRNMSLIGVAALVAIAYPATQRVRDIWTYHSQQRYAIAHLDSSAVPPDKNPFYSDSVVRRDAVVVNDRRYKSSVGYEDLDDDGGYASILNRTNSDGTQIAIQMTRDPDGGIGFPTLDPNAVTPLTRLIANGAPLRVDYVNVGGDSRLESVVQIGSLDVQTGLIGNPGYSLVQSIDGRATFSDIQ